MYRYFVVSAKFGREVQDVQTLKMLEKMALGRERETQTSAPGRKGLIYNLSLKLTLWVKADHWSWASSGTERCVSTSGRFWWLQEAHDLTPLLQQESTACKQAAEVILPPFASQKFPSEEQDAGLCQEGQSVSRQVQQAREGHNSPVQSFLA